MDGVSQSSNDFAYRRRLRRRAPEPSKLDILKASVKAVSKEYCEESSIGGLKHLVDEDTPYIERILWIMILIIGLICSVALVWMTFDKYYSAPLVTTQMPEGVSVSKIIFPAVGICTNNRISKKAVTKLAENLLKAERNKNYTEDQMLKLLYGLGQLYGLSAGNMKTISPLKVHHALGDHYDVHEMMRDLTPRCEDILLKCAWNRTPRNCSELFDFRLTMNGYCCTFNYLRKFDTNFLDVNVTSVRNIDMYKYGNKSTYDFDQGLKFLLRLDTSDDFFYNIPLQGSQLQFSDAYDFPDSPSGSFGMQIVSPRVSMTVLVSATFTEASRDIQHVSIKQRQCRFYDESSYLPFYTYSDCMLKCRMYFLLANCNCTPFNMLKLQNGRTCNMKDVPCLKMYYAQSITVRPNMDQIPAELELDSVNGGIDCPMCSPTCSKTAYGYNFNNVDIYPDFLNEVPDDQREDWLQGANFTGTSIVHVKYARDVADCYGRNVIMKWFDLISNIGSTCGFVTGFSFVSVLEFLYFFTVKLFREVQLRRQQLKNNVKILIDAPRTAHLETVSKYRSVLDAHSFESVNKYRSTVDPLKLAQFEHVRRYRPIYWNELIGSSNIGHHPYQ